jgi:hypothetical protein
MRDFGAVAKDLQRTAQERPALVVGGLVAVMLAWYYLRPKGEPVVDDTAGATGELMTAQGAVTFPSGPSAPFSSVPDVGYYPMGESTPSPRITPPSSPCGDPPNYLPAIVGASWACIGGKWTLVTGVDSPAPIVTPAPTPTEPAPAPAPTPASRTYRVQRGDTLTSIAYRYGTTWRTLYNLNRAAIGADPNFIRVGLVLVLP